MSLATGETAEARQQGARIVGKVGNDWTSIDEIARQSGASVKDAALALSTAELHGDVQYRKEGWNVQYRKTPESEKPKPGPTPAQLRKLAKETLEAERTSDDYYISLLDKPEGGWGKASWDDGMRYEKVKAIPVHIPGTEEADLFLHRPYGRTSGWLVSEGRSGTTIGQVESTRAKAVANAEARIGKMGAKQFMARLPEVITYAVMKYGQPWRSPRYGGQEKYGPSGVHPWRPGG